jgi:hypothetical protein
MGSKSIGEYKRVQAVGLFDAGFKISTTKKWPPFAIPDSLLNFYTRLVEHPISFTMRPFSLF